MQETIETKFAETEGAAAAKDIITIKQLPVMEEKFKEVSAEIEEKLAALDGLEVSEDTKTQVKKMLAECRKEFDSFEERRKQVKAEINRPYDELEKLYKTYISDKYKKVFDDLSAKIADIEKKQKAKMGEDALAYYNEYMVSLGLAFPEYSASRFAVNLSTTMKGLKEQIRGYLDGVKRDTESIGTFENADEIMVEYRETLDFPTALYRVNSRKQAQQRYAEEKAKMAEAAEQTKTAEAKVDEAIAKADGRSLSSSSSVIAHPSPCANPCRQLGYRGAHPSSRLALALDAPRDPLDIITIPPPATSLASQSGMRRGGLAPRAFASSGIHSFIAAGSSSTML